MVSEAVVTGWYAAVLDTVWCAPEGSSHRNAHTGYGKRQSASGTENSAKNYRRVTENTSASVSIPALVSGIRVGDTIAFDRLYLTFAERLWSFARRYVRTDEQAEDIVHDVFTAIWTNHATWNPTDAESYLFKAVLNQALLLGRRSGIVARTALELTEQRVATGIAAPTDAAAEQQSDVAWITHMLQQLPERARIAIRLRWYDDLSYAQIAHVLGVSEDAARMYVRRALEQVRHLVERAQQEQRG